MTRTWVLTRHTLPDRNKVDNLKQLAEKLVQSMRDGFTPVFRQGERLYFRCIEDRGYNKSKTRIGTVHIVEVPEGEFAKLKGLMQEWAAGDKRLMKAVGNLAIENEISKKGLLR